MKNRGLCALFAVFFILASFSAPVCRAGLPSQKKMKVVTDYKRYSGFSVYLMEGAEYMEINDVARIFDGQVKWYPVSGSASLKIRNSEAQFDIGTSRVSVDGASKDMGARSFLGGKKLFIPMRFVTGVLLSSISGKQASWQSSEKILVVSKNSRIPASFTSTASRATSRKRSYSQSQVVRNDLVVVIDPGHGGKDPGAIGKRGLKEKDVVLDISKKLAYALKRKIGVKVIMTRKRDRFIPLSKRIEIANKNKADIFISIHTNAAFSSRTQGFEAYFLSDAATDDEAAAVARLENSVLKLEDGYSKNDEVAQILCSLSLNEYMNESSELCSFITSEGSRKLNMINRGVRQAGFYVLKGADMPAVLVEVGFITNSKEAKKLRSKGFRDRAAMAISKGVERYLTWADQKTARR